MAKKNYTEEFLTEFRKVEQVISKIYGPGTTFRDVEQKLSDDGDLSTSSKMQVCRNIRNYATHNPDINEFMPIPEEACSYMKALCARFENQLLRVRDKMSRIKALSVKDKISYAAGRLGKMDIMPVVDDDGILVGVFNNDILRKCVAEELSLKTKLNSDNIKLPAASQAVCVTQQTPMEDVEKIFSTVGTNSVIVTDNGKPKGKYIGVVVKK